MTNDTTHRGGFLGFLTTIPGILTACAALVTAVGGLYYSNSRDTPSPSSQPVVVNITPDALPDDTISADEQIDVTGVADTSGSDPVQQMIDDCAMGYLDACSGVLDMLSQECYEGFGTSCDVLYQVSPVGSDYEVYGATCGGRLGWEYANSCGDL